MSVSSRRTGPLPVTSLDDIPRKPVSLRRVDYRTETALPPSPISDRVRGEFIEMRGFSPTVEQAARLFHLPAHECQEILGGLVREGFLRRTPDGRYRLPAVR
jgi:hypothetical protein